MDAEGGLEFLLSREDIDRRRIIVYGRSLGKYTFIERVISNNIRKSTYNGVKCNNLTRVVRSGLVIKVAVHLSVMLFRC